MILKLLSLLLLTLKTSRCSLVIDKTYQAGIKLSDYCPKMQYCPEGAHTMCVNYNPKQKMGPRCYNAQNITMTTALATRLLDLVNAIRSKLANGKETGKNDDLLPRGYGIFRLKWDNELATFAQVLANQCTIKQDLCRATKRFSHPGQAICLVRYTYPDWDALQKHVTLPKGLNIEQQMYAVSVSMKVWYSEKNNVTKNMVKRYPDWSKPQYNNQLGRNYLNMITGQATHMGCGISAFSTYLYYRSIYQMIQNTISLVCNFSASPRKGKQTYATKKPGKGFSAKCGCPPGSKEDGDCLCNEVKTPDPPQLPTCPLGETSSYCDPALILLPIFSIEDAPPEKLYQFSEEIKEPLKDYILQRKNTSAAIFGRSRFKPNTRARSSRELMEFIREKGIEDVLRRAQANKPSSVDIPAPSLNKEQQSSPQLRLAPDLKPPQPRRPPALRPSPPARPHPRPHPRRHPRPHPRPQPPPPPHPLPPPPRIPPPPPPPSRVEQYSTALQTYVKPSPTIPASRNRKSRPPPKLPPKNHQMKKKANIMTRVAQFRLPDRRSSLPFKVLKKDVEPRKDFSNLKQVVNDYLKRHPGYRIINGNNEQTQPTKDIKPYAEEKATTEAVAIDTGLNRIEETVINFDQYLGEKNSSNCNDKDLDIKDDNDQKLLSLLDTLEREVKHIALDGDEKQLFDAKIRKIYGSIAGKTAIQMSSKPILFSTPDPEAVEIDFGETKSKDQFEPNQVDNDHLKVIDEPKQKKRFKTGQRVERVKHISPSVQGHKWNNKFMDSFDQKKYNPVVSNNGDRKSSDRYDQKYNDNHLDNTYGDIQHHRMDELDHKHNENLNRRYNENLHHGYNEVPRKFDVNFDHPHHYDVDRKYNDDEPAARSKMKYQADRAVFREFEHNSLGSQENITPRNYKNTRSNKGPPGIPLITKDRDKRKRTEKKHWKRAKSLGSRKEGDVLSLERRKYYQEKLDKIKRKFRGRRNGRNNDPKNERSLRRRHMKYRESSGMRSKDQADQFYMAERAKFLHGF